MTDTNKLTRRVLLGTFAATSAVTLAACGEDAAPAEPDPDIIPLNNLLTKEYEAIKAYAAALPTLNTPPTGDPQAAWGPALSVIATTWQGHHRAHATQLAAAINAIGGTPVVETSVVFTPPPSFSATVTNVLKLVCNTERAVAVAHNRAIKVLTTTGNRFLAGTIEGDETQHFVVLYALLANVVSMVPAGLITNITEVVPKAFVERVSTSDMNSLQSVADFTYTA
ncbi:MAG: ferritin-like domain-containing protein [Polyangiales bacterium]